VPPVSAFQPFDLSVPRRFSIMRFRSEQHLRRAADIRAVREQGHRVDCRAFTLLWRERDPAAAAPARVCVIASTHAVGSAVRRNRAKRRLREVFRHQQARVPAGCDLVLVARRRATARPLAELETTFAEACARLAPPSA
jgi:ribonuclease P protein component